MIFCKKCKHVVSCRDLCGTKYYMCTIQLTKEKPDYITGKVSVKLSECHEFNKNYDCKYFELKKRYRFFKAIMSKICNRKKIREK